MKAQMRLFVCRASLAAALTIALGAAVHAQEPSPFPLPSGTNPKDWAAAQEETKALKAKTDALDAKARAAFAKGRYAEAEAAAKEAAGIWVCGAKTWMLLMEIYERQGKPAEALDTFGEMMSPQGHGAGSDISTEMLYVLALARAGRWDQAAAFYDRSIQREQHGTIDDLVAKGVPPLARLTDRDGMLAAAHFLVGTDGPVFVDSPDEFRMQHLREAVTLRPAWAQAHFDLAHALERLKGRLLEAADQYDLAEKYGNEAMKHRVKVSAYMAWHARAYRAKQRKSGGQNAPSK